MGGREGEQSLGVFFFRGLILSPEKKEKETSFVGYKSPAHDSMFCQVKCRHFSHFLKRFSAAVAI
jgi:hypothetical protein